jgi:hypothetical protein
LLIYSNLEIKLSWDTFVILSKLFFQKHVLLVSHLSLVVFLLCYIHPLVMCVQILILNVCIYLCTIVMHWFMTIKNLWILNSTICSWSHYPIILIRTFCKSICFWSNSLQLNKFLWNFTTWDVRTIFIQTTSWGWFYGFLTHVFIGAKKD